MTTAIRYTRFPRRDAAAAPEEDTAEAEVTQSQTAGRVASPPREERLNPVVILLLFSIATPFYFYLGPLWLSPNRVLLLLLFFPVLFRWLSGAAGPIRGADFWVIGLCLWIALAMFVSAGANAIQFAGITMVETLGAYLTARAYIRTEAQYRTVIRVLGLICLLLVPGAIIESLTGVSIYNRLFGLAFQTFPWADYGRRLGMFRAQTVFEHPILYGVFVAFCFAPVFAMVRVRAGRLKAWMLSAPILIATFLSLSMGAYLGVLFQLMQMGWGLAMHKVAKRWQILGILSVLGYVTVDLISNRTPFEVLSSYLAFDGWTAYYRVLILDYGLENVWENPILGLGVNAVHWKRPDFMAASTIDNFWLVYAIRYGIPGFLLIFGAYVMVLAGLMRARLTDPVLQAYRDALAFSFIGLGIAICTVHLWNATYVFMMFMMGAGAWLSDVGGPVSPAAGQKPDGTARPVLDRKAPTTPQPPAKRP